MKKLGLIALAALLACSSVACSFNATPPSSSSNAGNSSSANAGASSNDSYFSDNSTENSAQGGNSAENSTENGGNTGSKEKTTLNVTTFEGGYGSQWLEKVATRFEEQYANVSFEPGKIGVDVIVTPDRNLTHEMLVQNLAGSSQEVFFTEAVNYYDLKDRGLLYDISKAVTQPLNYEFVDGSTAEGEETVTVESKMRDVHKDYFKADDGKYYAIPFYEANYGIVYDVDLFEKYNLYFAAAGQGDAKGFVKNSSTPRSNGPDGKAGTSDDGLPATYDDFFKLCDQMVSKKVTPFTWGGKVPHYVNTLAEGLHVDYEGAEQMSINYTSSGTATNLVKNINADGSVELYSEEITPETGYLTWTKQAGRYYSLSFIERLLDNDKYYIKKDVSSPSFEHVDAQNQFVIGKLTGKPVGMLIDGSWWHNEAEPIFKAAAKRYGETVAGAKTRKFSFMPLPKATADKVGEPYTIQEANRSVCFVNGNLDASKEKVAFEFIQFCHTNKSLAEFTTTTLTCKPYTYTLTNDELNGMPFWGQELYRLHNEATFMTTYAKTPTYKANEGKFTEHWNAIMYKTLVTVDKKTVEYEVLTRAMFAGVSAKDYFVGLSTYLTPQRWETDFLF